MTEHDLLIHTSYAILLVSFMMRDMLWLRVLTVVSVLFEITYFYIEPTPLWPVIGWNLALVVINAYWITRLTLERRPVHFSRDEQRLYDEALRALKPRHARKLFEAASWKTVVAGERIMTQGEPSNTLSLVADGRFTMEMDGMIVDEIGIGRFVGSYAFLKNDKDCPAPITVTAAKPSRHHPMPIHRRRDIRSELFDDVYASRDVCCCSPKFKLAEDEHNPRNAYSIVHDERLLDGNARQNVATFCTTWIEPEAWQLLQEGVDKNIVDKDEYPQTAEIEGRCVHMLADLWNAPKTVDPMGCSTTGSSEAAMLAGMALKWRWRKRQQAKSKAGDKPNIVTGPVQICWHKFCRYWDVELREIPMKGDRFMMSPEEAVARCDEDTIGVVATLGTTFTCQYEPVKALNHALDRLQKQTGLDIPIHVDAASGGFLAPFVTPETEWDFRLPRVKSINASGHKFGLAPLGVGWIVWRDDDDLDNDLIFRVNYLGGNLATFSLNFSRSGAGVVCQYYNFLRLGRSGYTRI